MKIFHLCFFVSSFRLKHRETPARTGGEKSIATEARIDTEN